GPAGMTPIIVLAVLTYAAALWPGRLRGWTAPGAVIVVLVATLAFYKYSRFLLDNALTVVGLGGITVPNWLTTWAEPAAPLGISFFTFEFVHYLYEVRVHGRTPVRNPVHFGVFSIFFPTLAAGPIKRFPEFVPQLENLTNPSWDTWWSGIRRIIRGL